MKNISESLQNIIVVLTSMGVVIMFLNAIPETESWTVRNWMIYTVGGTFALLFVLYIIAKIWELIKRIFPKVTNKILIFIYHPLAKIVSLSILFGFIIYFSKFNISIVILSGVAFIISLSSIRWVPFKKYDFSDTFDSGLGSWNVITGNPIVDTNLGRSAPSLNLSVVPKEKTNSFLELLDIDTPRRGSIECEVFLESGSLCNIVFRADIINRKYYMARFDTRSGQRDKDAFLKNDGNGWTFLNSSLNNSTARVWHKMRIELDGPVVKLYKNNRFVTEINDNSYSIGKIGIFNERGEVHVDNFSVRKIE